MGNKQITQFPETTTPGDNSELLIQESGTTKKSKLISLLKRTFGFDDVYGEYLVNAFGFASGGGNTTPVLKPLRDDFYLWAFEESAQIQEGFFQIHLHHDMKENTDMTFHIHWAHNEATPSGNIKWNIDYTVAKGYEAGVFGASTTLSVIQTAGVQYAHHITDDDEMILPWSSGELEPDAVLICRIWRDSTDPQDTFAGDAFFVHADLHFVRSRVGTIERNRPFTSGNFPT